MLTTLTTALSLAFLALAPAHTSASPALDPSALFRSTSTASKAGLAWSSGNYDNIAQYESNKLSWYYTWSPDAVSADLGFVPMLWGKTQVDHFAQTINDTIARQQVTAVLGMNECVAHI